MFFFEYTREINLLGDAWESWGFEIDNSCKVTVTNSDFGQAKKFGIKNGWQVRFIDGVPVQNIMNGSREHMLIVRKQKCCLKFNTAVNHIFFFLLW